MKTIAISGKGGTGKSTVSALIIRWLKDQEMGPILAVDADSNVNLNDLLGVQIEETVGAIREELKRSAHKLPGGMTKQEFLEYKIHASLRETRDFDLIAMGRPEGPGCYCYANNLLRDILKTLSNNYKFVVIDNEAGMEHLSRRTTQKIDCLLLISDPSTRGVRAAGKISKLLFELDTRVGKKLLVLNRVKGSVPDILHKIIDEHDLHLFSSIPEDDTLLRMDQSGKPIWKIAEDSPASKAVHQMMTELMEGQNNSV
ncbi:MAG: AAA family ATPase [Candidatus Aminicenantes bacterium]|nr:MAG: AAA family ATPase [Candidatus Aminicenantes bacterium]